MTPGRALAPSESIGRPTTEHLADPMGMNRKAATGEGPRQAIEGAAVQIR